ncbi:hypothetical protein LCGC14_2267760, partial [marine sediment metagenome]
MKRTWLGMAAAACCTFGALIGGTAMGQSSSDRPSPRRGEMRAVIVAKGPAVDGTLADPVWAKCPELPLGECTGRGPGMLKTTARVLFDATKLYVGFVCTDPDTDSLKTDAAQRDAQVWADDCVELFVTGDLRTGYYHFVVNPAGVLFDSRTAGGQKDDTSWNSSVQVKATVQKGKGWTVTLAVPLAQLGALVG